MAAKIITFLITFLANITVGAAVFFVMLMAMNGYSESDSTYGIVTYIALAFIVSLLMGLAAFLLVGMLTKRQYNIWVSAFIAIVVFGVTGSILKGVCALIGIGVAEFVRVNF